MPMQLSIVTIEREVYSASDVDMVIAPGVEGELGILPGHESLVTSLKEGVLEIVRGDEREILAISGGFLEVHGTQVVVMAQVAEQADEIDVARAEAAKSRAETTLADSPSREEAQKALEAMRRAQVRLKVARRRTAYQRRESGGPRP